MGANYSPEWRCEVGYDKGHDDFLHVKQPGATAIIKEYKNKLYYKTGPNSSLSTKYYI